MSDSPAAYLALRVQAGASAAEVAGWQGAALRVRVKAPRERGQANAAVVDLLARCLAVRRRDIDIVRGRASRDKVVRITGLGDADLRQRLNAALGRAADAAT